MWFKVVKASGLINRLERFSWNNVVILKLAWHRTKIEIEFCIRKHLPVFIFLYFADKT